MKTKFKWARSGRTALPAAILLTGVLTMASATAGIITVPGTANIFAAGQASTSIIGSDGSVPPSISLEAGTTAIKFSSVTGTVHIGNPGNPAYGPESATLQSAFFIGHPSLPVSDLNIDRTGTSLWGTFLDDTTPTGAHPESLDFTTGALGISFASLSPTLRQTFFIGDGLTGTGSGSSQSFFVPAGATRLVLGVLDSVLPLNSHPGAAYYNNTGAFTVGYDLAAPVPEPGTWTLLLAGLGLIGLRAIRRV
ncbi:MAG: PEP-CTERM sorting domain-containing protein [Betaproteobacteria bacterium]|nr:PEP-CTERM sorting domain-containing protein [Betaproteobacteria bacterium]